MAFPSEPGRGVALRQIKAFVRSRVAPVRVRRQGSRPEFDLPRNRPLTPATLPLERDFL